MQNYHIQVASWNKPLAPPSLGHLGDTETAHALDTSPIFFAKFEMVVSRVDP